MAVCCVCAEMGNGGKTGRSYIGSMINLVLQIIITLHVQGSGFCTMEVLGSCFHELCVRVWNI